MTTTETTTPAELDQPAHLAAFLAAAGITLDLTEGEPPAGITDPAEKEWHRTAHHYAAELIGPNGARCSVPYFTGSAVTEDPTAADVVHTLLLTIPQPGETFEEYAEEYGIDTDSRRALAKFEQARRTGRRFSIFLRMAEVDRGALDAAAQDY